MVDDNFDDNPVEHWWTSADGRFEYSPYPCRLPNTDERRRTQESADCGSREGRGFEPRRLPSSFTTFYFGNDAIQRRSGWSTGLIINASSPKVISTCSEVEFSEVRMHDRAYNTLLEARECLLRSPTLRGRGLHVVVVNKDPRA